MKSILIVVNKYWECDAVMAALLNAKCKELSGMSDWPKQLNIPRVRGGVSVPEVRAAYENSNRIIELWCVSDFLEKSGDEVQSSTEEKAKVLKPLFARRQWDLVIAVGSAGYPNMAHSINGSVTIGTKVFMHDGHPNSGNPHSKWRSANFDKVMNSTISKQWFDNLTDFYEPGLLSALVKTPNNSATPMILANSEYLCLGTVNVTNYAEYAVKDLETAMKYKELKFEFPAVSIETTHGLLRELGGDKFMFVSGIADRIGCFDEEVTPGQNYAASFNAGVVLAGVISRL